MNLFILISRIPYPLEKGDKLRIFNQIIELSKSHSITLCTLNDAAIHPEAKKILSTYCKEIHFFSFGKWDLLRNLVSGALKGLPFQVAYFYSNKYKKQIHQLIQKGQYDAVYCQLIRTTEYIQELPISKHLDYMDVFSKGMERRYQTSAWPLKYVYYMEYKRLKAYERKMFDRFDLKTIISEQDRKYIDHPKQEEIHIIRNGVAMDFFSPRQIEKKYDITFVGNMSYPPNVKAVVFLVEEVLPLLLQKKPDTKILIAGANPHKKVAELASDHVEISGWIDDIRDSYASARLFVAPMHIGTGLQNKLLEAMAMKIPCITTTLANNALKASAEEICIADTAATIAEAALELLNAPEKASQQAELAYQFIQKHYSWKHCTETLNKLLIETVSSSDNTQV